MKFHHLIIVSSLGVVFCPASQPISETVPATTESASGSLAEFAWLAGTWRSERDGEVLEEQWNKPLGNCVTGSFRWLRNDDAWLYEFLLIEKTKAGTSFYLRHFGPGSEAWEGKKEPMAYPLESLKKNEAIFENKERNSPRRFIYRRIGDSLTVRLESDKDGAVKANEFRFKLAKSPKSARR